SGYEIPGLTYVGEGLSALRYGIEPSLIRPMLPVSRRSANYTKPTAAYNPSYTQMRGGERAAYLAWLAGGRCDPKAHSSYVWLFFYGLERRVLHDLMPQLTQSQSDPEAKAELQQIIVEVQRLKTLYGGPTTGWGLDNKTSAFLEVCRNLLAPTASPLPTDLAKASLFELQVGLGKLVVEKQPLPPEWVLAWYNRITNNSLPTVALRCPAEFNSLFKIRYHQKHGAGIVLKPGKSRLSLTYFPASPSFGRLIEVPVGNLPDLSRLTAKVKLISELVYTCRMELEPLGRLLGRRPEAAGTPVALALLPAELLETHGGKAYKTFQTWLKRLNIQQPVVVSGADLLHQWAGSNPDKFTPTEAQNLAKLLAHLGYALEPDPRLGGPVPTAKSSLALFQLPPDSPNSLSPNSLSPDSLSPAYGDAALLAQLALATASGGQSPSPVELAELNTQLAQLQITPAEQIRLAAQIQILLQAGSSLRSLKARIERADPTQLPHFGQVLIRVAAADGPVTPQEVKQLEKAYGLLDLDLQTLYSDIHDLTTSDPVTVRPAQPRKGHKLPARPAAGLDMALVQTKLAESAEISTLLADIFSEDPQPAPQTKVTKSAKSTKSKAAKSKTAKSSPPPHPPTPSPPPSHPPIPGLDLPHSALLHLLAQQPTWPRADLQAAATQLDLMLDGALEVINELAFERIDEPVTEGEDPIEVNQTVMQELLNL
ncbi:MAG: TerB N-terminal domain-containing protein, partial [Elainella sp.]